jgi:tRNA threonylcarbamoyl adenosine modification protein YeaZ
VIQNPESILALDTSTKICTVALRTGDKKVICKWEKGQGIHSELLFVFIEEVLSEAEISIDDLDGVIVTQGPGSYTGLRISASAVKGLLFNRAIPLYGVNTLAYFAEAGLNGKSEFKRIHSVIDARRAHLYHQLFVNESGELHPLTQVAIRKIETFNDIVEPGDAIIGSGIRRLPDGLLSKLMVLDDSLIRASALITIYDKNVKLNSSFKDDDIIRKVKPDDFEPDYYNRSEPQVNKK